MNTKHARSKSLNSSHTDIFFFLVIWPLSFSIAHAQFENITLDHLSIQDGLSQSSVFAILQDSKGFMWFGTEDGLNKYDGHKFTIYKYDPQNLNSISNNHIQSIYEDSFGNLWIGTRLGLNKFNPKTERFTRYTYDPSNAKSISHNNVRAVCEQPRGVLWIGTEYGLNILTLIRPVSKNHNVFKDISTEHIYDDGSEFIRIFHNDANPSSLSNDNILSLLKDRAGDLWISTWGGGINRLETSHLTSTINFDGFPGFVKFKHIHDPLDKSLVSSYIYFGFEDRARNFWIGTYNGLYKIDRQNGSFIQISAINDPIFTINEYNDNILLLGTWGNGLIAFNRENNEATMLQYGLRTPITMNSYYIYTIIKDRAGTVWIGTMNGGITIIHTDQKIFTHYTSNRNDSRSLSHHNIFSIYQDKHDFLWIGTYDGLDKLDRKRNKYTHFLNDPGNPNSISCNRIFAIHEDRQGILWIGTRGGGLNKYDRNRDVWTHYRTNEDDYSSLSDNNIFSIYEDIAGYLWIGTLNGFNQFDKRSETFLRFKHNPNDTNSLSDNSVYSILETNNKMLWIGTESGGLNKYGREAQTFTRYQHDPSKPWSISDNCIYAIFEDRHGTLWLGTSCGLNKMVIQADNSVSFVYYTEKHGLPNNVIYGIVEDDQGNLWLSTNRGLSKFDPIHITFKNYEKSDGLQDYEFNVGAYFKNPRTAEIFFGGINGFNSFFADSIKQNLYIPPIVLTSFKIFDQSIPLDTSITYTRRIDLKYTDNFFSFDFVALDFAKPEKNQYSYILEGLNNTWIQYGNRRYAGFTNVEPGIYTFRVKGTNNDGIWNEQGAAVEIHILPPFWKTVWFKILLVLSLPSVVFLLHTLRVREVKQQRAKLEVQVDQRTQELRQHKEEIERKEKLYRNLIETSPDAIGLINLDGSLVMANEQAAYSVGYSDEKAILGINAFSFINKTDRRRIMKYKDQLLSKQNLKNFECHFIRKDSTSFPVELSASLIFDLDDTPQAIICIFRDISERKKAEQKLNSSLKEKEVLLQEIHHRVKNNLQIISSLLNLQSISIKDPEALNVFRDSQNRVRSMALIHDILYQSKDLSHIDFAEYIHNLVSGLFRSYGVNSGLVELHVDIQNVMLGTDFAIPCGLIINELVSNSLKHAFPFLYTSAHDLANVHSKKSKLNIQIFSQRKSDIILIVQDNGVGFPENINIKQVQSLGLQLVNTLVEQLHGMITIERTKGTKFIIEFSR